MTLCTEAGRVVQLGKELGRGGEGTVYEVAGDPRQVAKIYLAPKRAEREAKIRAMVRAPTRVSRVAWPTEMLLEAGAFAGFLMPAATGKTIYHAITARREAAFPGHDWRLLVTIADNLARVFGNLHHNGVLVGDVNFGNVFVDADGTVTVIDVDSFHVRLEGVLYPTLVALPSYTPPEVLEQTLTDEARSTSQDVWAMAVLVFQLLFLGVHPCAGIGTPDEETDSIKARCFPFSPRSIGSPPPNSPKIEGAGSALATLFERTFMARQPSERPTAAEFVTALTTLRGSLTTCAKNPRHAHLRSLATCPWCALPHDFFPRVNLPALPTPPEPPTFDLAAAWQEILGIKAPEVPASAQSPLPPEPPPAPPVVWTRPRAEPQVWITVGSAGIAATLACSGGDSAILGFIAGLTVWHLTDFLQGWWHERINKPPAPTPDPHAQRRAPWRAMKEAHVALVATVQAAQHNRTMGLHRADKARKAIETARSGQQARDHEALRRAQALAQEAALRTVYLEPGLVPGVGQVRIAKLRSFQVETAWDVLRTSSALALRLTSAPSCPKCSRTMIQRGGRSGTFWGCPTFPRCRGTRQIAAAPIGSNALEAVPTIGPTLAANLAMWANAVRARTPGILTPAMIATVKADAVKETATEIERQTAEFKTRAAELRHLARNSAFKVTEAERTFLQARDRFLALP